MEELLLLKVKNLYLSPRVAPCLSSRRPHIHCAVCQSVNCLVWELDGCESLDSGFGLLGLQVQVLWGLQALPGFFPVQPEHVHLHFALGCHQFGRSFFLGRRWGRLGFGFGGRRNDFEFDLGFAFLRLAGGAVELAVVALADQWPVVVPLWEWSGGSTNTNYSLLTDFYFLSILNEGNLWVEVCPYCFHIASLYIYDTLSFFLKKLPV